MIKSMTGFASSDINFESISISIQTRSYNSKNLDIFLRTQKIYQVFEPKIKAFVANHIKRGRVEINITILDSSESELFEINYKKADDFYFVLSQLKKRYNINSEFSLDSLIKSGDIITYKEPEFDFEKTLSLLKKCLSKNIENLDKMRTQEGEFLKADLVQRIEDIKQKLAYIEVNSSDLVLIYKKRLQERINIITKGLIEIDPVRISQEAAFLADKSDISEEIVRLKSHFVQFLTLMNTDEPAGRKLNFLLQEINREFNTMGSKSGSAKIFHIIVFIKSELEKIREQIQNIE